VSGARRSHFCYGLATFPAAGARANGSAPNGSGAQTGRRPMGRRPMGRGSRCSVAEASSGPGGGRPRGTARARVRRGRGRRCLPDGDQAARGVRPGRGPGRSRASGPGRARGTTGRRMDPKSRPELCLRLLPEPRTRARSRMAQHRRGVRGTRGRHGPGPLHRGGLIGKTRRSPASGSSPGTTDEGDAGGRYRRAKQRGVDGEEISASVSALDPADEIDTARRLGGEGHRGQPRQAAARPASGGWSGAGQKGYPRTIEENGWSVRQFDQEGTDAAAAGIDLDDMAMTHSIRMREPGNRAFRGPVRPGCGCLVAISRAG